MQINDLQAVFLRYFLLYGDDAVGDDRIVDVPAGFEGRDRCTEENLWLFKFIVFTSFLFNYQFNSSYVYSIMILKETIIYEK